MRGDSVPSRGLLGQEGFGAAQRGLAERQGYGHGEYDRLPGSLAAMPMPGNDPGNRRNPPER
jgi:hypothetical protein